MAANPGGSSRPRDDQQAKLVERLRAAGGAPVDFDELRATPILAIVLTVGIASLLFDDPGRARAVHNAAHAGTAGYRPAGMGGRRAPRVAAAAVGGGTAPSARPVASAVAGALGPSSPAVAGALDLEGHRLLSDGRYAAAIGDLTGAIRASGQSLAGCMQPTSESCLTFAYALYDLGRALRLEGESGAAVQILSERLRIDNQRPVVQHELDLARGAGV